MVPESAAIVAIFLFSEREREDGSSKDGENNVWFWRGACGNSVASERKGMLSSTCQLGVAHFIILSSEVHQLCL